VAVVIRKKGELITKEATKPPLLTHHIPTTKSKPKNPFLIRSYAIAEHTEQTLEQLKQAATDAIGRPISSSAVLRALVRYLGQQPSSWIAKQIHPLLEQEIEQGRLWGTKGKTVPPGNYRSQTSPTPSKPGKVR
jgi:hypothetical protein